MIVLTGSIALTGGCATKSGTGAATGAVAGGLVGVAVGDTTGLLIGAALGGLLGHEIGRAMEREDQRRIAYALERNEAMRWRNAQTGNVYEVQPTRTRVQEGRQCREFRLVAEVGSREEEVYGTACRQPDGSWELAG